MTELLNKVTQGDCLEISDKIASGSSGRNFIGIEREPEYVEIANKRITEAQTKL